MNYCICCAQQPKILAFPKTCISITVTDSSLVGIDLGIFTGLLLMSNFHLSHFSLTHVGTVLSLGSSKLQIPRYSSFPSK